MAIKTAKNSIFFDKDVKYYFFLNKLCRKISVIYRSFISNRISFAVWL